jgi:hypothetical protein
MEAVGVMVAPERRNNVNRTQDSSPRSTGSWSRRKSNSDPDTSDEAT